MLGLRLNVGSEIQQSFALEIGAVTETVEVNAAQVQVQTTSGAVGSAVQIEQMMELPLAGRNIFNLVNLVPGAYRSRNGNISIGGGRTRSAGSYIDGINNTRGGLGVQNIEMTPPIDSMQEFKVEVNSMGAEYGRSSAGAVQAATRSGTNEYHGSIYHFVRNDVFDAIGWNQVSKPTLRRNQGGISIGGPIKKNKTFFFVNSDLFLNPFTRDRIRSVGRPEFRTGDFSRAFQNRRGSPVLVPIHDPDTRKAGSFTRPRLSDPFPNQQIPAGRFDPVAVKALSYLPQPTPGWEPRNPANQSGNWVEQIPRNVTRTYNTIKINHNYTAKWSTFLRTIISKNAVVDAYSDGFGVADPNAINNEQLRQNWGLNNTYMFSPTNFVAVLVGFNRVYIDRFSGDCCDTDYAELLGMPGFEKQLAEGKRSGGASPIPPSVHSREDSGGGLDPSCRSRLCEAGPLPSPIQKRLRGQLHPHSKPFIPRTSLCSWPKSGHSGTASRAGKYGGKYTFNRYRLFRALDLIPLGLWGQGGTINGTVTDETGAVIPGACRRPDACCQTRRETKTFNGASLTSPNMLFARVQHRRRIRRVQACVSTSVPQSLLQGNGGTLGLASR